MGFRQRHPGGAGQPRPAGDRGGGPVLPGQHHRGGPRRAEPDAARRPAAAAAGEPGAPPRTRRRVGAGLARRGSPDAARTARLLPGSVLPNASRGVRTGFAAVLRGPADSDERSPPPVTSTDIRPACGCCAVDHDGNSTSSPEEAAAIVGRDPRAAREPLDRRARTRPLRAADVLVVAPYNAQVVLLRRAPGRRRARRRPRRDRGQVPGRQAPVVFVSMTASSIDDVPRGISFLLNRNRLNVAVSRAKYASVIVRSTTADRLSAVHARRPGRTGRVPVAGAV